MKMTSKIFLFVIVSAFISVFREANAAVEKVWCSNPSSKCYYKYIDCPEECPSTKKENAKYKVCSVDCRHCTSQCKNHRAKCDSPGSACYDPRFVGSDGVAFYFHGKSNEHYSLVSDTNLQINGRFIGHRPAGRTRDFTWIQALGILFNKQTFSLEATKAATWDSEVDHLKFTYNGQDLVIPEESLSVWYSPEKDIKVERVSSKNNIIVTLKDSVEILITVVPATKKDDRIHNYKVPSDDCFVHLEIQFRFSDLSPKVDGVLGRTYNPDFQNTIKPGVAMPVLGGDAEERYRTPSLLSPDCVSCVFSTQGGSNHKTPSVIDFGTLDCTSGASAGYGIVCRK